MAQNDICFHVFVQEKVVRFYCSGVNVMITIFGVFDHVMITIFGVFDHVTITIFGVFDQCYDHNFRRFWPTFCGKNLAIFLQTNVMILFLHEIAIIWVNFYPSFWRKYF
jgi:hypothetical protein